MMDTATEIASEQEIRRSPPRVTPKSAETDPFDGIAPSRSALNHVVTQVVGAQGPDGKMRARAGIIGIPTTPGTEGSPRGRRRFTNDSRDSIPCQPMNSFTRIAVVSQAPTHFLFEPDA